MARRACTPIPAINLAALVVGISACKPDCPDGVTDRHGYRCTPVPTYTITSTEPDSSSGSDTTGDTSATDTSSSSSESSTGDTSSTTAPPAVCGDGACDPDENTDTCYADCGTCGNAIVEGPEPCDNGTNQDAPYSPSPPASDACAPDCSPVEFCGDMVQNGPESCDGGPNQTATCEANCRVPTCGDGTLNPLAGEACDDANTEDGDGCSADCSALERHVFVSSKSYFGDLNHADDNPELLAGIPLADARCNALALAASLPGTYKAWLSDSDTSPAMRFDKAFSGLYRLVAPDFPIVATGWSDLTDGTLAHAIDAAESGVSILGNVWTNTLPDGFASASDMHCTGWTAADNSSATFGQSAALDASWTDFGSVLCSFEARLFCFEDP